MTKHALAHDEFGMCGAAGAATTVGGALYAVAALLNLIKRKVIGIEAKWIDDTRPYILCRTYAGMPYVLHGFRMSYRNGTLGQRRRRRRRRRPLSSPANNIVVHSR